MGVDLKVSVRGFIQKDLLDAVQAIRHRSAMRFAKVCFSREKIYRRSSLSYDVRSTD